MKLKSQRGYIDAAEIGIILLGAFVLFLFCSVAVDASTTREVEVFSGTVKELSYSPSGYRTSEKWVVMAENAGRIECGVASKARWAQLKVGDPVQLIHIEGKLGIYQEWRLK